MTWLRISTSPPSDHVYEPDEAGYYCDLHRTDAWRELPLVRSIPVTDRDELLRGVAGFVVSASFTGCEIGLLVCVEDDEGEPMYVGIDHRGRTSCEPAANEALWAVANAGSGLPEGYRLARDAGAEA